MYPEDPMQRAAREAQQRGAGAGMTTPTQVQPQSAMQSAAIAAQQRGAGAGMTAPMPTQGAPMQPPPRPMGPPQGMPGAMPGRPMHPGMGGGMEGHGGRIRQWLQGLMQQRPHFGQHGEPDADERGGPGDGDRDDMRMRGGGGMLRQQQPGGIVDPRFRGGYR